MHAMELLMFCRVDDPKNNRGANNIGTQLCNGIDTDHNGDDIHERIASTAPLAKGFPEEQATANQE